MYRHGNSVPDVITDTLSFRCEYSAYVSIIGLAPCLFLFLVWRERSWRVVRNRYLRVFRLKGRRVLRVRPHRRGWGRWRIEGWGSSGLATNSISFCLLFVKKKACVFYLPGRPRWGGWCSRLFLSASPFSRTQTLEGIFELTRHYSRTINLAPCVASGTTEI